MPSVQASPVLGGGPGESFRLTGKEAHNDYLKAVVDTGVDRAGDLPVVASTPCCHGLAGRTSGSGTRRRRDRADPLARGHGRRRSPATPSRSSVAAAGDNLIDNVTFLWSTLPLLAVAQWVVTARRATARARDRQARAVSEKSTLLPPASRRLRHAAARRLHALRRGERELPRYFIVGAKRAGTTSLDEYIVDHPLVLRGLVEKGCRYYDVNYHRGPAWFRGHLPAERRPRPPGGQARGPADRSGSPAPTTASTPRRRRASPPTCPTPGILMVLRDPVQRAWSHYRYEITRGFETLDPVAALEAEAERLADPDERTRWLRPPALQLRRPQPVRRAGRRGCTSTSPPTQVLVRAAARTSSSEPGRDPGGRLRAPRAPAPHPGRLPRPQGAQGRRGARRLPRARSPSLDRRRRARLPGVLDA